MQLACATAMMRRIPSPSRWFQARAAVSALLLVAASIAPAQAHGPLQRRIEEATRRIEAAPDPVVELLTRGELHRLSAHFAEARADFDRAAALHPDQPGLALCRAALLFDEKKHAEARAALRRILARDPSNVEAWKLRAKAAKALGLESEAAEAVSREIALSETPKPDLYVEKAGLQSNLGLLAEAVRTLDGGIERLGHLAGLELAAADLEIRLGRRAEAAARMDRLARQTENPAPFLARRDRILGAASSRPGIVTASNLLAPAPIVAAAPPRRTSRLATQTRSSAVMADTFVTRGPYLQIGTSTGMTIRWRTDTASSSRVRWGTSPTSLTNVTDVATATTEHVVQVTGAQPATKYYYSVGTISQPLAGGTSSHSFTTSPMPGTAKQTRVWVVGDGGTADADAASVQEAFRTWNGTRHVDVWLMLGDNAYNTGTDSEYQAAVFDMYTPYLPNTVLWPTRGNHDDIHSGSNNDYYDIFSMPTSGQAGGLASGTEAYYSYDYGNIHFICLDSEGSDLSANGAMANWVRSDIEATTRDWVIAYWHHPPYSKGSHDSDSESQLIDMRENFVPILESVGVDLVLTGHSHSYERSVLLDGHYGYSSSLTSAMKLDPGNGRESGTGAYRKAGIGTNPHQGAVYTVAGASGSTGGGSLNHPIMVTSLDVLGSMILDVDGQRLDARYLDNNGSIRDSFTILKGTVSGPDTTPPAAVRDLASP